MQTLQPKASGPAYFYVDLGAVSPEDRQIIVEDALMGGGEFGVTVVEEVHNGPARQPIYGVYFDTADTPLERQSQRKWEETKATLGLSGAVDAEADPEDLRTSAEAAADADAAAVTAAEEAALRKIVGDDDKPANKTKR